MANKEEIGETIKKVSQGSGNNGSKPNMPKSTDQEKKPKVDEEGEDTSLAGEVLDEDDEKDDDDGNGKGKKHNKKDTEEGDDEGGEEQQNPQENPQKTPEDSESGETPDTSGNDTLNGPKDDKNKPDSGNGSGKGDSGSKGSQSPDGTSSPGGSPSPGGNQTPGGAQAPGGAQTPGGTPPPAAPPAAPPPAAASGAAASGGGAAAAGSGAAAAGGSAAAGSGAAAVAATPVGWVILAIVVIIILILLVIGEISFFQTMPGMILDKLKEAGESIWNWVTDAATGNDIHIDEEQIVDLANYIEGMGYDLYGYGFGRPERDENGEITGINDDQANAIYKYIYADVRTYMEENGTEWYYKYNPGLRLSRLLLGGNASGVGQGMLVLDDTFKAGSTVNYDTKTLVLDHYDGWLSFEWTQYSYNLDGWAGRYGMPISFSVALHLATMKPELVTTIIDTFNTKVVIDRNDTLKITTTPTYRDSEGNEYSIDDAYSEGKISAEQKKKINDECIKDDVTVYQPYITKVTNHWYYNTIKFDDVYTTREVNRTRSYKFAKSEELLGEDNTGEVWITEAKTGTEKVQIAQPDVTAPNDKIIEIFKDKYYTYDGTQERAQKIENGEVEKDEVAFDKKSALQAFSILENCKDLDSQYIYRDLKELLIHLDYFTEEDFATKETQVLKWMLSGYRPPIWPQYENNELCYETILYSNASPGKSRTGFPAEKNVASPGTGVISKISGDSIIIKFTEPELILDYTMRISGIEVNPDLSEGASIKMGEKLGKTTNSDIKLLLKDAKGSVVDNIADYMDPRKAAFDSDFAFLYWLPYESGGIDGTGKGPECVGVLSETEAAVGIAQWTTKKYDEGGGFNNIEGFCRYAYETDPMLCAELQPFIGKDINYILSHISDIRTAFRTVCNTTEDRDAFLELQLAKFHEEFVSYLNSKNISWIADESSVLQGTLASLRNWSGSGGPWPNEITQGDTDENNIRRMLVRAHKYDSREVLQNRWDAQYILSKDIMDGVISEEEIEDWVRHGGNMRYDQSRCSGALDPYL